MVDGINWLLENGKIKKNPLKQMIAAVSVGMYNGEAVLDLDYDEDSNADTDLNVIMTENGGFVEIQGTAEAEDRKSTRLNSSHVRISYAVFCLKKKKRSA